MKPGTNKWTQARRWNKLWNNLKLIENCKATCEDSVIHKQIYYNEKYKFLDTILKPYYITEINEQDPALFYVSHPIHQQPSNWVDKILSGIFNYLSRIALI